MSKRLEEIKERADHASLLSKPPILKVRLDLADYNWLIRAVAVMRGALKQYEGISCQHEVNGSYYSLASEVLAKLESGEI